MAKKKITTFCEKPLTFKDFKLLPEDRGTILPDEESLRVMFGIQENIRLLEPKGLDDVRAFHIETIGRHGAIIWYEVSIGSYEDNHWLALSSHQGESYCFANKDKWIKEEEAERQDCKAFLERLWDYVNAVVHKIEDDPVDYVKYLEAHVPYQEREGSVIRKEVQDLLPGIKVEVKNRNKVIALLRRKLAETIDNGYDTMTLRTYIEAWKIAYCAYSQSDTLLKESTEEVFTRSNCGRNLEEYDLDSPEDFAKWDEDCSPYHCYDVIYVNASLYPRKLQDSGKWHLELVFSLESFFGEAGLRMAFALEKASSPFTLSGVDDKLDALLGEDTIFFSPEPRERHLPYPREEGIKADALQKAIEAIEWVPFEEIRGILPYGEKRERIIFFPCDDDHYPEDDESDRCLVRYREDGQYRYWTFRDCPWGWNVLKRNQGDFCILP